MIDALVAGVLHGRAVRRVAEGTAKVFVTAKLRARDGDGQTRFINVVSFSRNVVDALLALEDGESVTLSGSLGLKAWALPDGEIRLDMSLTAGAYLVTRGAAQRRREMTGTSEQGAGPD